jgi:ABC-type bacteriocin/lantibiotic exporter with double-glycine peptidase domain
MSKTDCLLLFWNLEECVAVLNVTDSAITISDPLNGLETLSPQEFLEQWRYCGLVIQKHQPNLNPVLKTMD